jgi:hypothetical protein
MDKGEWGQWEWTPPCVWLCHGMWRADAATCRNGFCGCGFLGFVLVFCRPRARSVFLSECVAYCCGCRLVCNCFFYLKADIR